ncbi:Uncharacterised protein [Actinomyces bovis]|uniref:Uncharacterized protein n=1 Tax=Actinomyces bovis TaxID=1658 RepID=A0ABY1VN54_9ACTO|nr:hypothetical protein [Actinomyces bovis]SPT53531.1 Uncharacterised protein [Actinomyces bovis]VEG55483.1 Uncharacterised protein [Actinomyces israelii]
MTQPASRRKPGLLSRLLALRSMLSVPLVQRTVLDPQALLRASGAGRIGDLRAASDVVERPLLAELADADPTTLLQPDSLGWQLGNALDHAVEQRTRLWLVQLPSAALERLRQVLGVDLVHQVGPADAEGRVVAGVHPADVVVALSDRGEAGRSFLRQCLEGTDTMRCSRRTLAAMRRAEVAFTERTLVRRAMSNPVFLAYAAVFIYSSLRALPVAFVPGFTGHLGVLWAIDVLTAIPYTWGIVAMFSGRRLRIRALGLLTTLVTFTSPYIYFWTQGRDYPHGVVAAVVAMILGAAALEVLRWLRDVVVSKGLREHR